MTTRGGGGGGGSLPSTPWQRPTSCQEPSRKQTRGYAVSNSVSKRSHSSKPTTPLPSLQERGDKDRFDRRNAEEYRRNRFEGDRSRYDDRERDYNKGQGYNDRPRSNDRRAMVDGGNLNSNRRMDRNDRRYDHRHHESRESSLNMSNQRRPMMTGEGGERNYDGMRPIRKAGIDSGDGYRVSMDHRNDARRENFSRDHEREQDRQRSPYGGDMNDFGGYHNDRDRRRSRHPMEQEHHRKTGIEGETPRRREYNAKGSAEQEQQRPNQVDHLRQTPSTISRGDSKSRNSINGYVDRSRFSNHRDTWDSGTNARNQEGKDRNSSGWNRGRLHPHDGRSAFWEDRGREKHSGHTSNEVGWDRISDNSERDRGFMSGNAVARDNGRFHSYREGHQQQKQLKWDPPSRFESAGNIPTCTSPLKEDKPSDAVVTSARKDLAPGAIGRDCNNNITNDRKRQREDYEGPKIEADKTLDQEQSTRIESYLSKHAVKSSPPSSDTSYKRPKEVSDENKKIKLSASFSPPHLLEPSKTIAPSVDRGIERKQQDSPRCTSIDVKKSLSTPNAVPSSAKMDEKSNTKNIPVRGSSVLSIKRHQMPAKSKPKVINKLGIPMRWLKPKAKPKPPAKKVVPPKVIEDTSKSMKIPSKQLLSQKSAPMPSSPSNRLVTDSSEGSSIVSDNKKSTKNASSSSALVYPKKQKGTSVPAAIVTKNRKQSSTIVSKQKQTALFDEPEEDEEVDGWDSQAESEESDGEASESDTDDDEVLDWATKMLGVQASSSFIHPNKSSDLRESNGNNDQKAEEATNSKSPKLKIRLSSALKLKITESIKSVNDSNALNAEDSVKLEAALKKLERRKKKREKLKALSDKINEERPQFDQEKAQMEIEEERRKREEAKPLTAKELRKILREDTSSGGDHNNWVRRSRRQPNMALLNSKPVRILVDKLKYNDTDMRVLKMKKYINDPNTPCAVIDAILNAMEENTNCEALYIQNFNEGMRDEQVIHLLRILQQPSCKIWCLNIGENYNVSDGTWGRFTKGLIHTKITHMYASEHTITSDMKDEIRFTIRENRKKHDMHINPNNLDVIIQCTHCWWNPINAKVLRPFLKKKGYELVLTDKEVQGLQGSTSMAPTS